MELTLFDRLRPIIAPIATAIAVAVGAFLVRLTGIAEFSAQGFVEAISFIILWVVLVVGQTMFNKFWNPRQAASSYEAKRGLVEHRHMKRTGTVFPPSFAPPPEPPSERKQRRE